jgi:hypothetical protein
VSAQAASTNATNDSTVGIVQVQSTPDGAEVYLDNDYVGSVPAKLRLTTGKHSLRLELKGYKSWSKDLTVQAGSSVNLSATLEP